MELVDDRLELAPGRTLVFRRPPEPEALIDEQEFEERDGYLPYWAEVWPSGRALARAVHARDWRGMRVVELGAGLGLVSIAAALAGARVTASDWSADALEVLRENAGANGVEVETVECSWTDADVLIERAPWDAVLASDILYERRFHDALLHLVPRLSAEFWLADPGRGNAAVFLEGAREAGWTVLGLPADRDHPKVALRRLTRRGGPPRG